MRLPHLGRHRCLLVALSFFVAAHGSNDEQIAGNGSSSTLANESDSSNASAVTAMNSTSATTSSTTTSALATSPMTNASSTDNATTASTTTDSQSTTTTTNVTTTTSTTNVTTTTTSTTTTTNVTTITTTTTTTNTTSTLSTTTTSTNTTGPTTTTSTSTTNTTTTTTTTSTSTNTSATSTTSTTNTTTTTTSTTTTSTTTTTNTTTTTTTTSTTTTTTSTTTTTTTKPNVHVSFRLAGYPADSVATMWTARHYFAMEVHGDGAAIGHLRILDGSCGSSLANTRSLIGSFAEGVPADVLFSSHVISTLSWSGLRLFGGTYAACWCPADSSCTAPSGFWPIPVRMPKAYPEVSPIQIFGPSLLPLQDGLGRPMGEDADFSGCPSVNESFDFQVVGVNLTDFDRFLIVDRTQRCGGSEGPAKHSAAFRWPSAGDDAPGETGSTGDAESSRIWRGMALHEMGHFRVCWCVGFLITDAVVLADESPTDYSNGTNFSIPGPARKLSSLNATLEGNLSPGNLSHAIDLEANLSNASNTSGARLARTGVWYQGMNMMSPPPDICRNSSDYDVDLGLLAVAGPTSVIATDELTGRPKPRVGRNFSLTVYGHGLTADGRIRVISVRGATPDEDEVCGSTFNNTLELEGFLAVDPDTPGVANGSLGVTWHPLSLNRGGRYAVCWCSKRHVACDRAAHFGTTAGYVSVVWAGAHEILDADEKELRVLPGVSFTLMLSGIELSEYDRIRIVETSVTCGRAGASKNTPVLTGPLTREPGHSGVQYEPGVLTGPGRLRADRARLWWTRLRLYTGGVRRVCWCPGGGQAGSTVRACTTDRDYYYEVGTFDTIYIRQAWAEPCARARTPFRLHVAAVGLRPRIDRLLLVRAVDTCGERSPGDALPRGLKPYGVAMDQARADWGAAISGQLAQCDEDPNSAGAPGERKLVCGDSRKGTMQVDMPGLYRLCVCPMAPGYDCTHPEHYRVPAGELFEVAGAKDAASGAWQDVVATSAAGGGTSQGPLILNGPGAAALAIVYAPTPAPSAPSRVAVASEDGVVRLWEPETPRMVAELVGHTEPVTSVAWAVDSSYIVSGSADGTIRMWGSTAGVLPGEQPAHVCPRWKDVWQRPGGEATRQVLYDWTRGGGLNEPYPGQWTGTGGDATDQEWQHAIMYHLGSMVTAWLNLTAHGTPSQSSVRHGAVARRAIDDNEDGSFAAGSCTHTKWQDHPWWHVELGGPYAVRGVQVTNRADCCGEWLSPFFVYVDSDVHGTQECAANVTIEQGETIEIPCVAIGHAVRIELHRTQVLTLCEVRVRYQTTEDLAAGVDLKDLSTLTLAQAARHCEKACPAYRERAMPMCNCGPTFECDLMHTCSPRCGLEEYVWQVAANQRVVAIAVSEPIANATIVATATPDSVIRLWQLNDGARRAIPEQSIHEHVKPVVALAFAPGTEGLLASASADGFVIWHNVPAVLDGRPWSYEDTVFPVVHRFEWPLGYLHPILAIAFSLDGKWFAIAGTQRCTLWDAATRTLHRTLEPAVSTSPTSGGIAIGETAALANLAFASDSQWLALRLPTTVQLWPLASVAPDDASGGPPSLGEWVQYTSQDLAKAGLRWSTFGGPSWNTPVYEALINASDHGRSLHFTPCNLSATYHACAEILPAIRVDIEIPFDFTAVRGSFIEYSEGPNGADDCRGGTNHSTWFDDEAARYWTLLVRGRRVEGEDCPRVGGGNLESVLSLASCKAECEAIGFCNVVNWRQNPPSCDLRRCLDATSPVMTLSTDDDVWALIVRSEAEERLVPTQDGYVMFGTPDGEGNGGILYGGCGVGPELPHTGVEIKIPEQQVTKTRSMRWQVAQSRNTEKVGVRSIALEFWRPIEGRKSLAVASSTPAAAFSPTRRELTVAVGGGADMAVWDLRGIDFPAAYQAERLLKKPFSFELSAVGLLEMDFVRIVDASVVPVCGDAFSATTSMKIQGLGDGGRARGTHNYSYWDEVVATGAGTYRICFCGGRRTSCCMDDRDFSTQIFTFVVAGAEEDHYNVCEAAKSRYLTLPCVIKGFRGTGTKDGDKIMLQDAAACGLATAPLQGFPHKGVLTARKPHVPRDSPVHHMKGTWYRFESQNVPYDTYRVETIFANEGMSVRMCWCPLAGNCVPEKPSMFNIDAGILTVVRFTKLTENICKIGNTCLVPMQLEPHNMPVSPSDLIMVKTGKSPPNRLPTPSDPDVCTGQPVPGLGPRRDGISARMKIGYDTRPDAKITDEELGLFDMGTVEEGLSEAGQFRLCWCQASIRPCLEPSEFVADVGRLTIMRPKYLWPECTERPVPFKGWRKWTSFDECCCNHYEAGAVGCFSEKTETFARCSKLPRR